MRPAAGLALERNHWSSGVKRHAARPLFRRSGETDLAISRFDRVGLAEAGP
jgi:hypothetical protein